jgi:alpha-tubulin suppressor-like RCC1 family protein
LSTEHCQLLLLLLLLLQAAIGGWHCLALSDGGQVYCWGGEGATGGLAKVCAARHVEMWVV